MSSSLTALPCLAGVVEDDEAGADHADGVEDAGWLTALRHYLHLLLVQPGVPGLHLLPGLPAQLGVEEGEEAEGEGGQELEEVLRQLGGQRGQAGLFVL